MNSGTRRGAAMTVPSDSTQVTVQDLGRIEAIQSLLRTLNDPGAGADVLARHVGAIPVLKARVERRFLRHHPTFTKHDLPQQVALLGNRVLESILAEVLEDVIMLHSEIEPAKRYSF